MRTRAFGSFTKPRTRAASPLRSNPASSAKSAVSASTPTARTVGDRSSVARSSALEAAVASSLAKEYTALQRTSALAASPNWAINATGASGPSLQASAKARSTVAGTLAVDAIPTQRFSNSRMMAAPSGPPIFATAATASAWVLPCSSGGVLSTTSRNRSKDSATPIKPTANSAFRCTSVSGSENRRSRMEIAAGFPIRPMARAAWRRTMGSGCRAAARNSGPV